VWRVHSSPQSTVRRIFFKVGRPRGWFRSDRLRDHPGLGSSSDAAARQNLRAVGWVHAPHRILIWHKNNEASQRLASAPGVGPMTASAIVAAVGDGHQFKSARHFAAWLGLTPRISASGGKERIGKISKGGGRNLRTLLIHGARGVVGTTFRKNITPKPWLTALIRRRPVNVAATAVAHKTARALWAMLTRGESYRRPQGVLTAA